MQKWYIVMAKPRQEYSATSFLGQAGVEPYYLEADGCFRLKRRGLFRRQVFLQAILRGSTTSETLEGSSILGGTNERQ
jgi:hypothetical protein